MLTVCAATTLIARSGEMSAAPISADGAHFAATQRIREDEIRIIKPAALSHDGRLIAFVSRNPESSQGDLCQVYVLDRSTGTITQESISPDRTPLGDSRAPSLSLDGRVITFETLDPPSGNQPLRGRHVVVRNRENGVLRTPQDPRGEPPDGDSGEPVVSENGLTVVFRSNATNLASASDANGGESDVYLWRLDDSTIIRISVDSHGVQPPMGASHSPSVSSDGELIAFTSTARLASEDTNDVADVYLRDVGRGLTTLVSRGIGGRPSDGASYSPALSADRRSVVFVSRATNLALHDRNQDSDVYVYDIAGGSISLVSATSTGRAANAASLRPAVSADGRYVAYQSVASNLGSGPGCPRPVPDTNLLPDVYLFDRTTRCVTRISGSPAREWWTPSVAPAIDGSGTVVAFSSTEPASEEDLSTDFDLFLFLRPGRETSTHGQERVVRAR